MIDRTSTNTNYEKAVSGLSSTCSFKYLLAKNFTDITWFPCKFLTHFLMLRQVEHFFLQCSHSLFSWCVSVCLVRCSLLSNVLLHVSHANISPVCFTNRFPQSAHT